jgi:flagellar biosynthesis/type III secretory pathway chaperone
MHTELQAVLNDTLELSHKLVLCLDRENACLIARKYAQLMAIAEQKQQLVNELDGLDQRRQGLAPAQGPFEHFLENSGNTQLGKLWAGIQSNIRQCAHKNEVNGRLLQRHSRLTRETMEILTGRRMSSEKIYDARGRTTAQGSLLPNIEA